MKVVLDTNIYIAAALQDGLSRDIFEFISNNATFILIISEEILLELSNKLKTKFNWSEDRMNFYLRDVRSWVEIVQGTEGLSIITRDPGDNKILECAVAGEADLIVTLDQDLIKLKKFKGIGIVHPKTFSWTFPKISKAP